MDLCVSGASPDAAARKQPPIGQAFCRPSRSDVLEALYRGEHERVLSYLVCKVGIDHAPDLAHEVFLRVATSPQLLCLRNPAGYLHRAARNAALDFIRSRQRSARTLPLIESSDAPCRPQQDDGLCERDAARTLQAALADLPDKTAQIFRMNRFERKTYREIHLELNIALPTVDYHMMKALEHLRSAFLHAAKPRIQK